MTYVFYFSIYMFLLFLSMYIQCKVPYTYLLLYLFHTSLGDMVFFRG